VAVTFAQWRDRRRVQDIEGYSRQTFKAETVAGLEPTQRPPQAGRQGDFGGAGRSGGRRFEGGGRERSGSGFGERRSYGGSRTGGEGYGRKSGFGDASARFGDSHRPARGDRAPRGEFARDLPRGKSMGGGGKPYAGHEAPRRRAPRPYER